MPVPDRVPVEPLTVTVLVQHADGSFYHLRGEATDVELARDDEHPSGPGWRTTVKWLHPPTITRSYPPAWLEPRGDDHPDPLRESKTRVQLDLGPMERTIDLVKEALDKLKKKPR